MPIFFSSTVQSPVFQGSRIHPTWHRAVIFRWHPSSVWTLLMNTYKDIWRRGLEDHISSLCWSSVFYIWGGYELLMEFVLHHVSDTINSSEENGSSEAQMPIQLDTYLVLGLMLLSRTEYCDFKLNWMQSQTELNAIKYYECYTDTLWWRYYMYRTKIKIHLVVFLVNIVLPVFEWNKQLWSKLHL